MSGLGKVIMFLSKSDEETTPNKRLANDLINKWEELEEQQQMLLRRQIKTAPKVPETKARNYDTDVDLYVKPKSKLGPWTGEGRAQIPKAISMDFKMRPQPKVDLELRSSCQEANGKQHP